MLPIVFRHIRADDGPRLESFFRRLSPETRYQRFHSHISTLSPAMRRYLVMVDGHDHVALVAVDARDAIVGVARCIRLANEPDVGEVAITIEDAHQELGLGSALIDELADIATANGIHELVAYTLANNKRMEHLLTRLGKVERRAWTGSYGEELRVQLATASYRARRARGRTA